MSEHSSTIWRMDAAQDDEKASLMGVLTLAPITARTGLPAGRPLEPDLVKTAWSMVMVSLRTSMVV